MTNEELVQLYQQGDKQALEKLIEQNMGIIYKLANKFYVENTNSIDKEDLIQEGYIGLITAANKYRRDLENPTKFITYAVYWIYQKMNRFINQKNTNNEISIYTPTNEDDTELVDNIESDDYGFENVEERIYIQHLHEELEEVMLDNNSLRERKILKLHYGWDNTKCMTLSEIGEVFNISGSGIRQIEAGALRKIRKSPWGQAKAKSLYREKKYKCFDSFNGVIHTLDFKSRYLDDVIGGIK